MGSGSASMPAALRQSAAASCSTAMPYDIVGVTPASFFGVEVGRTFDVAVPLCAEPLTPNRKLGASETRRMVSRSHGPAEAGLDDRSGYRASRGDFAADVRCNATGIPTRRCEGVSDVQTGRASGRQGRLVAAPQVRVAAMAAAGDNSARAAHRVREPGEPDARARDRARTRNCRKAGDWRVPRTARSSTAGRERSHRGDRRGGGRASRDSG